MLDVTLKITFLYSLAMVSTMIYASNFCDDRSELFLFFISLFDHFFKAARRFLSWTNQVQQDLYSQNHPLDCRNAPILLCSTRVNKFQGMGSRLFFLGRCLAEGLNSGRVVVLSNDLPSTLHMLAPFRKWSNCTAQHLMDGVKKIHIRTYYPMDSDSLVKSKDMPAVGALYPRKYAERGYWWWKAQEISYALRPLSDTLKAYEGKYGKETNDFAVFQVRRTDKTEGCDRIYGNNVFLPIHILIRSLNFKERGVGLSVRRKLMPQR